MYINSHWLSWSFENWSAEELLAKWSEEELLGIWSAEELLGNWSTEELLGNWSAEELLFSATHVEKDDDSFEIVFK